MKSRRRPKVTVAMPARNAGRYVEEAVESVLAQRGDFELVVMDDASVDDTWTRLQTFRSEPRIRLFRDRSQRGAGTTRNALLQHARGRYVMPCDADDILLPGAIERLGAVLDASPRVGVVYGDILELTTDGRRVVEAPRVIGRRPDSSWDLFENVVNHAGSMMRRSLALDVGGYDQTVYSVDDWSLWLKMAEVTSFKHLRGEIYYLWRRHPSSLTRTDPARWDEVRRIQSEALVRRYGRGFDDFARG